MRQDLSRITITPNTTIREALELLGHHDRLRILIVENKERQGIITEQDIRRGLLQGLNTDDPVKSIVNYSPITAHIDTPKKHLLSISSKYNVYEIPILDHNNRIAYIQSVFKLIHMQSFENPVVIMAGGLGTRLRPLTNDTPKPMLKIGKKPILQLIIERFHNQGFSNFILCVNYKSYVIEKYFEDGRKFGVKIQYIHETTRMGTAGALGLIQDIGVLPFFVINGDILTEMNFSEMLQWHQLQKADITLGLRDYTHQIPYGVIDIDKNTQNVISISEKPILDFKVSAGIYILNPKTLSLIPKNQFFDMPHLLEKILDKRDYNISSFLIEDYWTDIGQHDEYKRANDFFENKDRDLQPKG